MFDSTSSVYLDDILAEGPRCLGENKDPLLRWVRLESRPLNLQQMQERLTAFSAFHL